MAGLDKTVYSGKQFEAYISIQSDALSTNDVSGTLYKMRLTEVNDIDWSAGFQTADVERTGQRVLRPTDHIKVYKGGTFTWSFDGLVIENEALLQTLLQLVSEDDNPSGGFAMAGNQATVAYEQGASTGEYACIVISSPDADKDRLMHSAILQELTLSMNPADNGGRLTASGTFWSGYQPVIGAESTSPDATAVNWTKGFFDCTTSSIGGDDVVMNNFELTISNPATRVGYETVNSIDAEPCAYMRGGLISVTGSMSVKLDDNVAQILTEDFLVGTSANVSIGDGSSIDFDIPTAKYTGHTNASTENGVFVDLPFTATADDSGALVTIIAT
ncbi:MAG: hypothetical protein Unbinned6747contig1000_43 [Prokaryotic dsDNA virus sp.]|nr:MAG: hypothetical protein Unbinned6747contig1000_43 [Prokaryotic dsDNA virus sp.]|tara:strand:+ start:4695 stop:5687 length:993 start_codon:yes stop_codon:yes gene_type:complete